MGDRSQRNIEWPDAASDSRQAFWAETDDRGDVVMKRRADMWIYNRMPERSKGEMGR